MKERGIKGLKMGRGWARGSGPFSFPPHTSQSVTQRSKYCAVLLFPLHPECGESVDVHFDFTHPIVFHAISRKCVIVKKS